MGLSKFPSSLGSPEASGYSVIKHAIKGGRDLFLSLLDPLDGFRELSGAGKSHVLNNE